GPAGSRRRRPNSRRRADAMHGTFATEPARRQSGAPLVLRLALREMRAGLRGFLVFVACIALGVEATPEIAPSYLFFT
ncbi:MAG: hypothetical protein Q8807_03960, partial ['Waltheria sp.' little leaf phytoplasma]|nr:hypothetical protein ['Waltheria sp.' little leaf phytoplasma]